MIVPAFYPILDADLLAGRGLGVIPAAEALLEAGVGVLQFRYKGFITRGVFEQAECVAAFCRSAKVQFVMNDRADLAMLLGSALHLGQHDLAPADARRIMPRESLIGFSTHNARQLREGDLEPVDYLAVGPVFSTGSKKNPDPVVGLDQLRALRTITKKPLVAIGGITRETARLVLETGADSVAVIGDVYPQALDKLTLRERAEEWMTVTSG